MPGCGALTANTPISGKLRSVAAVRVAVGQRERLPI
jgi:hypothetical protein